MIFLWGLRSDSPLADVADRLSELGTASFFLDQRLVARTTVTASFTPPISGRILIDGVEALALEDVTSAYLRPYDSRRIPTVATSHAHGELSRHAAEVDMTLLAWADLTAATVVNRPQAMISNDSKPYQARIIRQAGFATPETLITTDAHALQCFREQHGPLIYKSISSTRSIVHRLDAASELRLENLRWCPTLFQRHVPGRDVRVHVIGGRIFAAQIESDADDYRYANAARASISMQTIELPPEVADRCRRLADTLGLAFAGIDLRLSTDDRWYCFEVNPSPGYSFFQQHTGAPIDEAVASYLVDESRTARGQAWMPGGPARDVDAVVGSDLG